MIRLEQARWPQRDPTGRPGDLWSGQAAAWRRWRRRDPPGRGPLGVMVVMAVLVLALTMPVLVEDAPDPCTALEARIAKVLSAPGTLQEFGETGRFGRTAARRTMPWLPPVIGCIAGWWQVAVTPSSAPGWFAVMR